ncbi:MAG: LptF/LptG family permease, partial [Phycisphaerae bacterium]|nr:LptF/LptG family permease [Phycisphaerae bacterium]
RAVVDFHGPRIFQMYQYLAGLVAVGAMGFTFAQLHRNRELVAMMAAGISLPRVALPIIVGGALLGSIQAFDHEVIVPRLAAVLMREHTELANKGPKQVSVQLVADDQGSLLHADAFDRSTATMHGFVALERGKNGALVSRVQAHSATWDESRQAWILKDGRRVKTVDARDERAQHFTSSTPVTEFASSLSPGALVMRQNRMYAHMLSSRQILAMVEEGSLPAADGRRFVIGRWGAILANLLVLVASLPYFLLREPANLLEQSVRCAAFAIPMSLGAMVAMTVPLSGLGPTAGVLIPIAFLIPLAVWRLSGVKT